MEIGLFQLENLALTPMPFAFLDLRPERTPVHPFVDPLLTKAEPVAPDRALAWLTERMVPPSIPIVLLSEDGDAARALWPELEAAGFAQIYVVEHGTRGLAKEAAEG